MHHDELTPLLLMREELQPKPSRMATLYVQQARTTIVHSPFYNEAVQRFYPDAPTYHPSTPRNVCPQVLPTPPQTIHRAGPSRTLELPASLRDASEGSATKLPPVIPHDPNTTLLDPLYQLDPDSSDETIAEDPEVIVIDSDSDQELSRVIVLVPFLVVFFTIVRMRPVYS
jgi:hypothetical protein